MSVDPSNDDLAKSFEEFAGEAAADGSAGKEKAEFQEEGNNGTFVSISRKPRSLEEHLAAYRVDLAVWKVDKWVANQWEMATARLAERITTVPIYQTKAWLSRIAPQAVLYPEVQPVELNLHQTWHPPAQPAKGGGIKRALIIPDIQTGFSRDFRTGRMEPFHDRRALDVALQVAGHMQPDVVVFNGDDVDLPDWSDKFVRSPEMYFTSQASLAECAWWKAQFRLACPAAVIHWIAGNHEQRMERAILVHNVASYDLRSYDDLDGHAQMSIPKLCALDKIGVQYHGPYPHGEVWLGDKFRIVHGETVRSQSGKTVAKMTEDLRHSEVQGHIHRVELACKTYWKKDGSRTYMAASFGTMARIAPGVVPGFKSRQNWQNGFGVVEFEEGGEGLYNVRPVLIFDGCTVYGGVRWTGRLEAEIVADIQATLGDKVRVA